MLGSHYIGWQTASDYNSSTSVNEKAVKLPIPRAAEHQCRKLFFRLTTASWMKQELGVGLHHRLSAADESKQGRNSCPVVSMVQGVARPLFHPEPVFLIHFTNQEEVDDLVRDLGLTKGNAELLISRLQEWNSVDKDCRSTAARKRHEKYARHFDMKESLCYSLASWVLLMGTTHRCHDEPVPRCSLPSCWCSIGLDIVAPLLRYPSEYVHRVPHWEQTQSHKNHPLLTFDSRKCIIIYVELRLAYKCRSNLLKFIVIMTLRWLAHQGAYNGVLNESITAGFSKYAFRQIVRNSKNEKQRHPEWPNDIWMTR